jgi:hypothetical protein
MLMPIQGKKVAKETAAKKPASKQRKSACNSGRLAVSSFIQ